MNCPHCNTPVKTEKDHEAQRTDAAYWPWGCQPFDWRAEVLRLRVGLEKIGHDSCKGLPRCQYANWAEDMVGVTLCCHIARTTLGEHK